MDGRNVKPRVNHIFESVTVKESEAVYIIQVRYFRTLRNFVEPTQKEVHKRTRYQQ